MALEMNTIGIKIGYCVETSAGTRPGSGYTNIPDIKEIPEINASPSQLEVTNLVDTKRRYISGVEDVGSDFALTANMTANLKSVWSSMVSAAKAGWASGLSTWYEISVPNYDSFYFAGMPSDMGVSAMSVDAVLEATLHIIPNQIAGWASASS